jgi:hypothetical protein
MYHIQLTQFEYWLGVAYVIGISRERTHMEYVCYPGTSRSHTPVTSGSQSQIRLAIASLIRLTIVF